MVLKNMPILAGVAICLIKSEIGSLVKSKGLPSRAELSQLRIKKALLLVYSAITTSRTGREKFSLTIASSSVFIYTKAKCKSLSLKIS